MGFAIGNEICIFLISILVLFPALSSATYNITRSRASYYGPANGYGTSSGACGFGEFGRTLNKGDVSAVSGALFKDGAGCGACYQVSCIYPKLCKHDGAKIVVTDRGEGDRTDFIMSGRGFSKMAISDNAAKQLFAKGVVDVVYWRVPCKYNGHNVTFKVHEYSRYRDYLALILLYVGGQNDITSVLLWQQENFKWVPMRRAFGAVWDMPNPPKGPISLKFQVTTNAGKTYWVQSLYAIPEDWKVGADYESKIQLA